MADYDALKDELLRIAEVLGKFPELIRPKVYDLLVAEYLGRKFDAQSNVEKNPTSHRGVKEQRLEPSKKNEVQRSSPSPTKRTVAKETYSIDRSVNLRGDGSIPSFKDFYTEKGPKGAKEFNAVTVYYLAKILGISPVTLNHAYTCYAEVKIKPPKAFKQSFFDAKNKTGWLEFDEAGNLAIPHRGIVFVEHDLPHKESPKA